MADLFIHVGLGWGVFKCGIKNQYIDFGMPVSYTTDAPLDTLVAIKKALMTNEPLLLEYDAEDKGLWSLLASDEKVVATREEKPGTVTYELDITKTDLMKQLVSDIMDDIDGWSAFGFDTDNVQETKNRLQTLGLECLDLLT